MSFQRPFLISLKRDSEQPWGFRLVGGKDKDESHIVQKVAPGSLAERCGLREGDELIQIGRINVQDLTHGQVEDVILRCHNRLEMFVIREDPLQGRKPQHEPQTIKAVVHAQYNSPMGLYSSQNIADTLGQTAEYALGERDPRKAQPQPAPSYDSYQRQVAFTQQQTSSYNYGTPQRAPPPAYQQHPGQQQQYPSHVIMNNTQPQSRAPTSYYQQQQSPYERNAPPGYTEQQPQSKSSFQRVEQRFEREHPQVPQSPKRVEFSPQATVLEERRVGFPDQSQTVRMEKQVHQQIIQQEREHVQRQQNEYRIAQNEREQRHVQQAHRQVVQNDQEYTRTPQSPKPILRSEQQRPQSPRPVMKTEEEEEYQRKPVQERAAAFQEIIQTQEQAVAVDQRTQQRGAPYERQVSTSTVQLKQVSTPPTERSDQVHQHPRPHSPRPLMRTDEDVYQRKVVQERAAAYKEMVHSHEQKQSAEQHSQQRGPTYEKQVSTSTVQLKQVQSPTPDTRREHQQRAQYPPSPKVTSRVTTHASPSPSLSPAGTPNTTRKRMEAIWPPKMSNVKQLPKTGFNTTSTGKQLVWPPSKSGWDSDGSWPPSGRQTPQSPPPSRKMANTWNPSPSPPPMRRAVASPVAPRKAVWPPPSRSPEKSTHFQPINKPHRKHGKFEDYIHHHASCGVPATYRAPPSVQHVEVNY